MASVWNWNRNGRGCLCVCAVNVLCLLHKIHGLEKNLLLFCIMFALLLLYTLTSEWPFYITIETIELWAHAQWPSVRIQCIQLKYFGHRHAWTMNCVMVGDTAVHKRTHTHTHEHHLSSLILISRKLKPVWFHEKTTTFYQIYSLKFKTA